MFPHFVFDINFKNSATLSAKSYYSQYIILATVKNEGPNIKFILFRCIIYCRQMLF